MGVSRSRTERTPGCPVAARRGVFGTVFAARPLPPEPVSFPLARGPYGAVCFVRQRAPLGSNYEPRNGGTPSRLVALELLQLLREPVESMDIRESTEIDDSGGVLQSVDHILR